MEYIIIGLLSLCVLFSVISVVKSKNKGGCGGKCAGCPYSGKKCKNKTDIPDDETGKFPDSRK